MGRKFHRGFVVIPTDLSSDSSICGLGYGWERGAFISSIGLDSVDPRISYSELYFQESYESMDRSIIIAFLLINSR
ncbi:hypothetical protein [Leptospira borgpetersenii]|uniref:hypothetical protein n=1 Tax=Leptospira borgpetersenii TaxID=174 RepID=UPI000AFF956C|nr:hypothetical protein [Leptospira borgpetersenii]